MTIINIIKKLCISGVKSKKNCLNCHFFYYTLVNGTGFIWNNNVQTNDRKKFKDDKKCLENYDYSLSCSLGRWDEGVNSELKESRHKNIVVKERGDCFTQFEQLINKK